MSYNSYYEAFQDQRVGNLISDIGPANYPSHFHKKVEITYMKVGHSFSVINNQKILAEKDDLIFVPEYYPHSYATSDEAERYVVLPTEVMQQDFQALANGRTFFYLLADKHFNRTEILPVLNDMYRMQCDETMGAEARSLLSKGYITTLYGKLYQHYAHLLCPRKKQINYLADILLYLDKHCTENITLDSLAQEFNYNKFYISKLFNSCVNDNIKNYINSLRINKFIQLYLTDPSINITHTALNLGFDSMPPFYRAFKRIYNCTPKEYFSYHTENGTPPPRKSPS